MAGTVPGRSTSMHRASSMKLSASSASAAARDGSLVPPVHALLVSVAVCQYRMSGCISLRCRQVCRGYLPPLTIAVHGLNCSHGSQAFTHWFSEDDIQLV